MMDAGYAGTTLPAPERGLRFRATSALLPDMPIAADYDVALPPAPEPSPDQRLRKAMACGLLALSAAGAVSPAVQTGAAPMVVHVQSEVNRLKNDQNLQDDAHLAKSIVSGIGPWLVAHFKQNVTSGTSALIYLDAPSTTAPVLASRSPADLASMADQIMRDPRLPLDTVSQTLYRLATARGTAPGDVDSVVSRTTSPDSFATHLMGAQKQQFMALQHANQAHRGDWAGWQAYMDAATGTHLTPGTRVQTYIDGPSAFAAEYQAIDNARSFVNLSIYDFNSDQTGWDYAGHLAAAAERGVPVRVMYDDWGDTFGGGPPTNPALFQYLQSHGVQLVKYQDSPMNLYMHLTHRKLLVTDDGTPQAKVVAMTGGMNIADWHANSWHDVFSRVTGPGATDLAQLFLTQWSGQGGAVPDALRTAMLRPQTPIAGAGDARIVGHVGLQDQNMKLAYLRAIDTAQTSIQIADPYMTDPGVFAHLITAAKQGVQVSLAFPKTNNKPSTQAAAEHYFPALLAAGVHITLYDGAPMAHSKIAIFDGRLVTIGTSNLDGRSLTYQDEDNVWTDDPAVAADLNQRYFVHDMAESQVVTSYHPTVKQSIENAFYAAAGNYL